MTGRVFSLAVVLAATAGVVAGAATGLALAVVVDRAWAMLGQPIDWSGPDDGWDVLR